jgi:putative Mg2+ transporter-C (MgtC) family protein
MDWTIVEKLLVVFVLTFLFGIERQRKHTPVGFGTFVLVAIGSCGLTIVATQLTLLIALPLLGATVTGVGFLGAGALMGGNATERTSGFITATSVWLFAIFGIIIGLGYYEIGIMIYAFTWIIVIFDRNLEKGFTGSYKREITIKTKGFMEKKEITDILSKYCMSFKLVKVEMDRKNKEVLLKYLAEGLKKDIESLLREFYQEKWCISVELG